MDQMLYKAIHDACLVEYDETTGHGYFKVIDGDAPPAGSVHLMEQPITSNY